MGAIASNTATKNGVVEQVKTEKSGGLFATSSKCSAISCRLIRFIRAVDLPVSHVAAIGPRAAVDLVGLKNFEKLPRNLLTAHNIQYCVPIMKLSNPSTVPVYTIAGSSTARPLPEWLARKRKRSLKKDPEYANRIELLQDFEFEEASSCVRVSDDGEWVMSTGRKPMSSR